MGNSKKQDSPSRCDEHDRPTNCLREVRSSVKPSPQPHFKWKGHVTFSFQWGRSPLSLYSLLKGNLFKIENLLLISSVQVSVTVHHAWVNIKTPTCGLNQRSAPPCLPRSTCLASSTCSTLVSLSSSQNPRLAQFWTIFEILTLQSCGFMQLMH